MLDLSTAMLAVLCLSTAYGVFYSYRLVVLSELFYGFRVLLAWVLVPLEVVPFTFWLALFTGLVSSLLLAGLNPLRDSPAALGVMSLCFFIPFFTSHRPSSHSVNRHPSDAHTEASQAAFKVIHLHGHTSGGVLRYLAFVKDDAGKLTDEFHGAVFKDGLPITSLESLETAIEIWDERIKHMQGNRFGAHLIFSAQCEPTTQNAHKVYDAMFEVVEKSTLATKASKRWSQSTRTPSTCMPRRRCFGSHSSPTLLCVKSSASAQVKSKTDQPALKVEQFVKQQPVLPGQQACWLIDQALDVDHVHQQAVLLHAQGIPFAGVQCCQALVPCLGAPEVLRFRVLLQPAQC